MGERSNDYNADCIVVEQASEATGLYLLLDKALPATNLVTLLFALEHCQGIEQLRQLVHTILKRTRAPRHRELRHAFLAWTKYVLWPRAVDDLAAPAADTLEELEIMLVENSRSWSREWKLKGLDEGLLKGREEGKLAGEAALLERLLARRFGLLPEAVSQRLRAATSAQLETWSLNILDAKSLDDVFAD